VEKIKNNNEIPTAAYQTTTTTDAQTMNHAKWNTLPKNVSKTEM
jgi:hypothetical protein